jgi:phosphoribosylformimino-5-aminoimidazole carboxamide ribotide isomerase
MEVVPVVDLKGGVVVRARSGERASYRPIETPLSATSEPLDVVAGLLAVHPFRKLYIADLDAIEGRGNAAILDRIAKKYPVFRCGSTTVVRSRRGAPASRASPTRARARL